MRAVLELSVALLALVLLVQWQIRQPEEGGDSPEVDLLVFAKGPGLPGEMALNGTVRMDAAIIVGDRTFSSWNRSSALDLVAFGPGLHGTVFHRLRLRSSPGDVQTFARLVEDLPLDTFIALASFGRLDPASDASIPTELMTQAFESLSTTWRPDDDAPISWAYMGVRRHGRWVPIAEAHSRYAGVVLAHTLARDLSSYDDRPPERVEFPAPESYLISLRSELTHARTYEGEVFTPGPARVPAGPSLKFSLQLEERASDPPSSGGRIVWEKVWIEPGLLLELGLAAEHAPYDDAEESVPKEVVFRILVGGEELAATRVQSVLSGERARSIPLSVPLDDFAGAVHDLELRVEAGFGSGRITANLAGALHKSGS